MSWLTAIVWALVGLLCLGTVPLGFLGLTFWLIGRALLRGSQRREEPVQKEVLVPFEKARSLGVDPVGRMELVRNETGRYVLAVRVPQGA